MTTQSAPLTAAQLRSYALADEIDAACLRHDKRALLIAWARQIAHVQPDKQHDIGRIRHCAAFYAGEIHGWDIDRA